MDSVRKLKKKINHSSCILVPFMPRKIIPVSTLLFPTPQNTSSFHVKINQWTHMHLMCLYTFILGHIWWYWPNAWGWNLCLPHVRHVMIQWGGHWPYIWSTWVGSQHPILDPHAPPGVISVWRGRSKPCALAHYLPGPLLLRINVKLKVSESSVFPASTVLFH